MMPTARRFIPLILLSLALAGEDLHRIGEEPPPPPADEPGYLVEVLWRYPGAPAEEDRLYYCRRVLFASRPVHGRMPGLGLDEGGQPVPPVHPGYALPHREHPLGDEPPVAYATGYIGARFEPGRTDEITIRESDTATAMSLPGEDGAAVACMFKHCWFRVERLPPGDGRAAFVLRDDPGFYRGRVTRLMQAALSPRGREDLAREDRTLAEATVLFRDPDLLAEVRQRLAAWIAKTPQEVDGRGFPGDLCDALRDVGTGEDAALFAELLRRHPAHGPFLTFSLSAMAKRVGMAPFAKVLLALLASDAPNPWTDSKVALLLTVDDTIPPPTVGDLLVKELVREFELDPGTYGLTDLDGAAARTLAEHLVTDQKTLARLEGQGLFHPHQRIRLVVTVPDRQRGAAAMKAWIEARTAKAPAPAGPRRREAPSP